MEHIKPIGDNVDVTAAKIEANMKTAAAEHMGLYSPRDLFMFWVRMNIDLAPGSVVRAVRIVENPEIASQEDAAEVARLSQAADDGPEIPVLRQINARVQFANIPEWGAN